MDRSQSEDESGRLEARQRSYADLRLECEQSRGLNEELKF